MSATALAINSVITRADLVVRLRDTLGVEIPANLMKDVMVAGVLEIRHHDDLRVGVGVGAGESEFLRGPQAEQLVAPRGCLELEFLIVRELLLESLPRACRMWSCACPDSAFERRKSPAALHIEGAPSRQPQPQPNTAVAVDRLAGLCRLCSASPSVSLCVAEGPHRLSSPLTSAAADLDIQTGATAFDGFHQATVHSHEPPSPHL